MLTGIFIRIIFVPNGSCEFDLNYLLYWYVSYISSYIDASYSIRLSDWKSTCFYIIMVVNAIFYAFSFFKNLHTCCMLVLMSQLVVEIRVVKQIYLFLQWPLYRNL